MLIWPLNHFDRLVWKGSAENYINTFRELKITNTMGPIRMKPELHINSLFEFCTNLVCLLNTRWQHSIHIYHDESDAQYWQLWSIDYIEYRQYARHSKLHVHISAYSLVAYMWILCPPLLSHKIWLALLDQTPDKYNCRKGPDRQEKWKKQ